MVGNTCTIKLITISYKGSLSKLYTSIKVSVVVIGTITQIVGNYQVCDSSLAVP
jgi:hypothetical protein